MLSQDLTTWLTHIRTLHPSIIDYSLERIRQVAQRLDLLHPRAPVIMVTGTNGKGSTVSAMEAILLASHHRVGSFTSPYLLSFNEQIRIDAQPIDDHALIKAFAAIEVARGDISLSEFEFTTLAALMIFKQDALDIILFEVGLGGGNDATNIIDADVTVVTSLALDHEEYLGATIELIAANEAQLLRSHKIGIIGITAPPLVLTQYAEKIDCKLVYIEQDFYFEISENFWCFWNDMFRFEQLPLPIILCKNAALAIQALLACKIKFSEVQLAEGLNNISIQGRLQYIPGEPSLLIDVAHNLEAVAQLAEFLQTHRPQGQVIAVFSMLKDKKITEVLRLMAPLVDEWLIALIEHVRGAPLTQLIAAFKDAHISDDRVKVFGSLSDAYSAAKANAQADDLVLVFGSFFVARAGLEGYY